MNEEEKTTIILEGDQAALVVGKDWNVSLYIPSADEEENVPTQGIYIAELAILTKNDEEFVKSIIEGFEKRAEGFNGEEDEEADV